MSSHHFVKEGQEPALLILDAVPFDVVKGLLEWAPTIIVAGQAIEHVLLWGIKVDVVVVEGEPSESIKTLLEPYLPVEIISAGDQNVLRSALDYLNREEESIVNVATSGDNPLTEVSDYLDRMNITFICPEGRWTYHTGSYKKWVPAASSFEILKGNENQQIQLDGVELVGDYYQLETEGWVTFNSAQAFWVLEKFF